MLQTLVWLLSPWSQHPSSCKTEPYSLEQEFDFLFCSLYWVRLLQIMLFYPICWDTGKGISIFCNRKREVKVENKLEEEISAGSELHELARTKNG